MTENIENLILEHLKKIVDVTGTGKRSLTGSGGQQGSASAGPEKGD